MTPDAAGWVVSITLWGLAAALILLAARAARRKPRELALAAASSMACLLLAEAGLRLLYPPALRPLEKLPSARYHHLHRADSVMYQGTYDGVDVVVRTNEDGFRTRHSRASFLGHAHRVAVIGDSFTFGSGVRQDETFPAQMEEILAEELGRDRVAVLNAGVVSWSPIIGVRAFDGLVRHYRPQHVLYVLDASDVGDDLKYSSELVRRGGRTLFHLPAPEPSAWFGALAQVAVDGGLWEHLLRPVRALGGVAGADPPAYDWYDFELEVGGVRETNRFFIYRHSLETTRPWFEATWQHILELEHLVSGEGARFTLVIMPRYHHWNPEECARNWEAAEYAVDEPWQYEMFEFFEEKRAESPFEIVDLLPVFREALSAPLVFEIDPHLNAAGHALVARALADRLLPALTGD